MEKLGLKHIGVPSQVLSLVIALDALHSHSAFHFLGVFLSSLKAEMSPTHTHIHSVPTPPSFKRWFPAGPVFPVLNLLYLTVCTEG